MTEGPRAKPFILFLDIDGVIATATSYMTEDDRLDRQCMAILNQLLDSAEFEIVIHSTWKHLRTLEQLQDILADLHAPIIDTTLNLGHRGHEIGTWLRQHERTDRYLILDDMIMEIAPLFEEQHFVFVNPSPGTEGLTPDHLTEALEKLQAMEQQDAG